MFIPSEEIIELLVADHIDGLLAYWDNQQVCRFSNNAYVKWFVKSREDLVGKRNMEEFLGPDYEFNRPNVTVTLQGKTGNLNRRSCLPMGKSAIKLLIVIPS